MSRFIRAVGATTLLSLMICSFSACGGGGGGGGGDEDTTDELLRIVATDAPFPFEDVLSATVLVRRIEIRAGEAPFTTLIEYDPAKELDLTQLTNGTVDVLYEGSPPPGTYDAIRIIVEAKEITIMDGDTEKVFDDFKVPSGEQTGIKVFIDNDLVITGSLSRDLVLDFDLGQSFVVQGNPNTPAGIKGFHFKPVIRAINASTAGSLTFLVMSDAGTPGDTTDDIYLNGAAYDVADTSVDPAVIAASGSSGSRTTEPPQDGYVFHPAVMAGSYQLTVAFKDHDSHVQPLVLNAANLIDLGTITLAATSGMIEGIVTAEVTALDGTTIDSVVAGADAVAKPAGDPTTTSATDQTNSMGGYQLSPLVNGTYDVTVSKTGYTSATTQATPRVFGQVAVSVDLKLVPLTANVTGTVTDSGGSAVNGATVQALMEDQVVVTILTNASGVYTLTGLPTGTYTVKATGGGETGEADLEHVGGGSAATVNIATE
jgi:uncharacterized protein DUF4382/carboxypeptidase family protein